MNTESKLCRKRGDLQRLTGEGIPLGLDPVIHSCSDHISSPVVPSLSLSGPFWHVKADPQGHMEQLPRGSVCCSEKGDEIFPSSHSAVLWLWKRQEGQYAPSSLQSTDSVRQPGNQLSQSDRICWKKEEVGKIHDCGWPPLMDVGSNPLFHFLPCPMLCGPQATLGVSGKQHVLSTLPLYCQPADWLA